MLGQWWALCSHCYIISNVPVLVRCSHAGQVTLSRLEFQVWFFWRYSSSFPTQKHNSDFKRCQEYRYSTLFKAYIVSCKIALQPFVIDFVSNLEILNSTITVQGTTLKLSLQQTTRGPYIQCHHHNSHTKQQFSRPSLHGESERKWSKSSSVHVTASRNDLEMVKTMWEARDTKRWAACINHRNHKVTCL